MDKEKREDDDESFILKLCSMSKDNFNMIKLILEYGICYKIEGFIFKDDNIVEDDLYLECLIMKYMQKKKNLIMDDIRLVLEKYQNPKLCVLATEKFILDAIKIYKMYFS